MASWFWRSPQLRRPPCKRSRPSRFTPLRLRSPLHVTFCAPRRPQPHPHPTRSIRPPNPPTLCPSLRRALRSRPPKRRALFGDGPGSTRCFCFLVPNPKPRRPPTRPPRVRGVPDFIRLHRRAPGLPHRSSRPRSPEPPQQPPQQRPANAALTAILTAIGRVGSCALAPMLCVPLRAVLSPHPCKVFYAITSAITPAITPASTPTRRILARCVPDGCVVAAWRVRATA